MALQTKVSNDDPLKWILPALAEWDGICAATAYQYIVEAVTRGIRVGAAEISIRPSFFVDNPAVTQWLQDYTIRLAGNVNRTTINALRDTLIEGIDAGESGRQLAARIRAPEVMGDEANKYRARMIARTETSRAENAGREKQLREAGAVRKIWKTAQDPCEWCAALNGRTIGIEESFFSRGQSFDIGNAETPKVMHLDYSDIPHPPLHPHCRCVTQYEFEGE